MPPVTATPAAAPPRPFTHHDPDVQSMIRKMARMGDASPSVRKVANALRWDVGRLLLAAWIARDEGLLDTWVDQEGKACLVLGPFLATRFGLELAPDSAKGLPKEWAWLPPGTRPGKCIVRPGKYEVRPSSLAKRNGLDVLAMASERGLRLGRSDYFEEADDRGLTPEPAEVRGDDRILLSPLPAAAHGVDLAVEHDLGLVATDEFLVLAGRHLRPVGLSRTWTPRDVDRAPEQDEHGRYTARPTWIGPAEDPRLDFTADSPRFWRFRRYGPARVRAEFEEAMARELSRQADRAGCPGCGDREVSIIDCELKLLNNLYDVGQIPNAGRNLIILANLVNDAEDPVIETLHFRVFDGDGRMVVMTNERRLTGRAGAIRDLRAQIRGLWHRDHIDRGVGDSVAAAVAAIVGGLGPDEMCPCCGKAGGDRLIRADDREVARPDDSGIAEREAFDADFGRRLKEIRRECEPWWVQEARDQKSWAAEKARRLKAEAKAEAIRKAREEAKAARLKRQEDKRAAELRAKEEAREARRKVREEKAAVERSRTRPGPGKPRGSGMRGTGTV